MKYDIWRGIEPGITYSSCVSKLFYIKVQTFDVNQLFLIDCYFKAMYLINVKKNIL